MKHLKKIFKHEFFLPQPNTKKLNRALNMNVDARENIVHRLTYKCGHSYYNRGYLERNFDFIQKLLATKHPTINYTNPNTFHYNKP